MAKISTQSDYKCSKCGELFDSMDALAKHNREKHGANSPIIGQIGMMMEARLPDQPTESRQQQ